MDEKVTVGNAVVAGYRFGFGRLGAVIGAAWLPTLVMIALLTLVEYLNIQLHGGLTAKTGGAAFSGAFGMTPVSMLVEAVFEGMAVAGVMAIALERRQPSVAYFSFGPAALRMIAAYIAIDLIMVALVAVLLGIFIGASFAFGMPLPAASASWSSLLTNPLQSVMVCATVPGFCPSPLFLIGLTTIGLAELAAFIYVLVRLTFFLPAVVVAEEQIKFGRAWRLSRGNFWRVCTVWFSACVPTAIAIAMVQHYATKLMIPVPAVGEGGDMRALAIAVMQGAPAALIVISLIHAVQRMLTTGLGLGAQAKAYNELTMSDAPSVF